MSGVVIKIKEVRMAKGISQSQLANMVGDKQPHVVRWEKGQVSIATLKKIALALDCSLDDLVGKVVQDESASAKEE